MSLIRVDTLVIHHHAPPPLFVQAGPDEDALAELFSGAGGAGDEPPTPPRHLGNPGDWDDEGKEDRALDLAQDIISAIRDAEAIHRRNAVRFDALFDLVGKDKALEFLQITRECAEPDDDSESLFDFTGRG